MKEEFYKKLEAKFPLMAHRYQEVGPLELTVCQLARGNTFNMRVVGMEGIQRFRQNNPDCAVTFKPNHLSEADFLLLSLLFRENDMRVVTEGGSNLFIDHIDIFQDVLPLFVNPDFKTFFPDFKLSLADYLSTRGAFKVFREPETRHLPDGTPVEIGKKEILSLSRAYRHHLLKEKAMYVTFAGYSSVKSGLMDLIKKDDVKTGRSYTGKFDGFHHLPFQMDLEASLGTGVDVYVVDVNIAYSPVLEDENFIELLRLQEQGASKSKIYLKDLGYIVQHFCRDKRKGELSIKFGKPVKMDTAALKDPFLSRKIKNKAQDLARRTFDKSLSMQPVFPANIYFSAFDLHFNRLAIKVLKDKIDDIRDHLRHLVWGMEKRRVDLHYVMDYRNHIFSADEIINRTFDLFNNEDRQITARDGDMFVVYNSHVAMQYRNHIAHFLEELKKPKKKR
jgi:glycerol-3-phosphate O-acyltransferase